MEAARGVRWTGAHQRKPSEQSHALPMQTAQGTVQPFSGMCCGAGICTTEALQGVPLDSPQRPGYNDSSADAAAPAAAAAAPAPAGPQPPPVTGTGRASGFTRPAVSTGGGPNHQSCAQRSLCC